MDQKKVPKFSKKKQNIDLQFKKLSKTQIGKLKEITVHDTS